jgi:hypothetical protein
MRERGTGPKLCRVRARFIPFALIVALMVAACDSGGSGGDPTASAPVTGSTVISHSVPPHPASPTVPADVPTTGPNLLKAGEQPPVMSLEATQHTPAGAIAFAKFFELTIDWGYAVTSTAYMKHYIQPTCVTCKSIQIGLDNAAAKHRHFIGGRLSISTALDRGPGGPYDAERSVDVTFRLPSVEVVDSSGAFVNGDPAFTMKDRVYVRWVGSGWTVVEIQPMK